MKTSRCQQSIDVNALEEEAQASLDIDSLFGCSDQEILEQEPEPGFLDTLEACIEGVDPKWLEAFEADGDNTTVGELGELGASCAVGASFTSGGGPAAAIGCVGGMLGNELSELAGLAAGAGGEVLECLFAE